MEETIIQPSTRRERLAWYMYDFGNSAYASVVLLAVYSAYFKGQVVGGAEGSRMWGMAVGIAMLVVAITAPILGTIADFSGSKKRFLFVYTIIACVFTALLFFVTEGNVVIGMLFFILAEIGYRSAQVFYNALLPEIADPEEMGRISGNGWAIGSAGGVICLIIVLAMVTFLEGAVVVRLSFFLTSIYFIGFALPLFLWLKERKQPQELPEGENYISLAFKRIAESFRSVRKYRELVKFIVSFLIYNDGIMMTMNFAAIIGAVLYGLEQEQLIIFMIIVLVTNVAGSYLSGLAADRFSGKNTLIASILLMVSAVVWLLFSHSKTEFYFIGALAGFAMAGLQAVSRMMVGRLSPPDKSAEFYGFFAIAGRSSSFVGPAIYGWAAAEAALWFQARGSSIDAAEVSGQRFALIFIIAFLLVGLIVLLFVNEKEGQAAVWTRRTRRRLIGEGLVQPMQSKTGVDP